MKRRYERELHAAGRVQCPLCGLQKKRIKRSLNAGMVRALAWLVHHHQLTGKPVLRRDAPASVKGHNEITRLALWELMMTSGGEWVPTTDGIAFVLGGLVVPEFVMEVNSVVESRSTKLVGFHDVLPNWEQIKHEVFGEWSGDGGVEAG